VSDEQARAARQRRRELVPQLRAYGAIDRVFWPIVTATAAPGFSSGVVSTDSRGHRLTRLGEAVTKSDDAPDGAAFLLGGSYAFGVGASDDAGTLAAALWRRTGVPYVNLGIRAATSAQELVSALPFVERTTTFVVCSGLNNFATAPGAPGLDPLFGPMHHQRQLGALASVSIDELSRLVADPLGQFGEQKLGEELKRRRRKRMRRRFRPVFRLEKRVRGRFSGSPEAEDEDTEVEPSAAREAAGDPAAMVVDAAARQIRDLRLLRRLVPAEAKVVFALQPVVLHTDKELSSEEQELFDILDLLQPGRWPQLKSLLDTHWPAYTAAIEEGCRGLGVPFADLSRGDYHGWCFVDRVHMTDHGHDSAAAMLVEVIADGTR